MGTFYTIVAPDGTVDFSFTENQLPARVAFHTLGCKLNFSESSSLGRLFEENGYAVVDFEEKADIYVINTCSVTEFADRKCRKVVRQAQRTSPDAKIIVTGCYAQLKPKEIAEIPGVDMVLGAAEKFRILDFIGELTQKDNTGIVHAAAVKDASEFAGSFSFGDRTRSFLKIQDGCDYKCTFCTIPQARGASRSDTIENVIANAHKIAALGCREIVLAGVNIGDFGNGTEVIEGVRPKKNELFIDLIRELDKVDGIDRIRISSIEPNLLTDEVIAFVAGSKRFMPHFHIPLQSGNNKQLTEMRRRYRRELYADKVAKIKELMPDCCIGVDVIVGFPGETDEDFLETYRFINELDVSYLHVFTYSERANTPAAEMGGVVPLEVRRNRNEMLRILSEKKKRYFYEQHIGTSRPVLFEKESEGGQLSGFTDNYIKINSSFSPELVNQIKFAELQSILPDGEVSVVLQADTTLL